MRGAAEAVEQLEVFVRGREVHVHERFAARGKRIALADFVGQSFGNLAADVAKDGVNDAAQQPRIDAANGFVDWDDAADFSGIGAGFVAGARTRIR